MLQKPELHLQSLILTSFYIFKHQNNFKGKIFDSLQDPFRGVVINKITLSEVSGNTYIQKSTRIQSIWVSVQHTRNVHAESASGAPVG